MNPNVKKTFWQRGLSLFASKHLAALTLVFLGLPCLLPAQILQHRYSFVNNANDSVGTANGTLIAPSAGKPAATINNGLILPGVGSGSSLSGYVQLPSGIVNGDYSVTVECWVKENVGREWAEIWDFGSSTTGLNFALIPDSNIPNLEVAFNNAGNNDIYTAASAVMATGSKQYVVITYNNSTLTGNLYTNGVLAGTTAYPNTSYSPGGFGSTTYDYLGNDVYGDEQFDGTIYELRIWSGVISPLYLAASTVAGSSVLVTNLNPTSISIGVATNMVGNGTQQAIVAVNLPQTGTTNVPATSTATNWVSGNTNVLTVNSSGLITAVSGGATMVKTSFN